MAEPNTGGVLRTSIADMEVGDYIKLGYNNGTGVTQAGHFWAWNYSGGASEIPLSGYNNTTNGGYFYMIKVEAGLLIADRVVRNSISWDTLNSAEFIQGKKEENSFNPYYAFSGKNGIFRSLGGGNSYADASGNSSATDAGLGAWPTDNEWDEYIVRKDYGTGAGRDDVWHWSNCQTWTQDTLLSGMWGYTDANKWRVDRGLSSLDYFAAHGSNLINGSIGFRPVFQFDEGGAK
jgi:hypothetical protein